MESVPRQLTDADAFIARIVASPADDLPRLVFADWLDEHGQPERAEFVRVQIELVKTPHKYHPKVDPSRLLSRADCWHDCPACQMTRRAKELLNEHWTTWCRPWRGEYCANFDITGYPVPAGRGSVVMFARGFVAKVRCDWPAWRDHGDAIRREQPVERVVLPGLPPVERTFNPSWARLGPGFDWHPCGAVEPTREVAARLLALWLPGVEFELPPEPRGDREAFDAIMRSTMADLWRMQAEESFRDTEQYLALRRLMRDRGPTVIVPPAVRDALWRRQDEDANLDFDVI